MPKKIALEDVRKTLKRVSADIVSVKTSKRGRGRPAGVKFSIPKHVFLDPETRDMLADQAAKAHLSESAYIRTLIQAEKGNASE
jgi:hypothetical protein